MVEIYNSELLEEAGLVAICDDDSVTIYTLAELTNGFKKGDIIVKKDEHLNAFSMACCMCRYCGFNGEALETDAFYIRRKNGEVEKYKRYYPMTGLGYTREYRLATEEEKEFFNKEIEKASYIEW
jgi:hypothetical protein